MPPSSSSGRICLVVGASGFIGRSLCEQLRDRGYTVRALLRNPGSGPWHEAVAGDLERLDAIPHSVFDGVATVFYLASIPDARASLDVLRRFNVDICMAFCKRMMDRGVRRMVYVSSTKAIAEPYDVVADDNFTAWPDEPYGISKREAEEKLLSLSSWEHLVIIRPCLVYGVGVKGNLASMIKWIDRGVFPALPQSQSVRSMISAADVSRSLIAAAESPIAHGKRYIVTDNARYTAKDIETAIRAGLGKQPLRCGVPLFFFQTASAIFKLLGRLYPPLGAGALLIHKLIGPAQYRSERIRSETGWQSLDTFQSVLPAMIENYRTQLKNNTLKNHQSRQSAGRSTE